MPDVSARSIGHCPPGTDEPLPAYGSGPAAPDAELVAHAVYGSREAYDILAARHSPHAYRVAVRITGDHYEAQDVVQESFVAAWQGLPRFRGDARFSTWLHSIVANTALSRVQKLRRHSSAELPDGPDLAAGPALRVEQDQRRQAVTLAVRALPPAQRSAVVLYHLEGLSYDAIAAATNSSEPSVRSHLFRGRRALASALQEWR